MTIKSLAALVHRVFQIALRGEGILSSGGMENFTKGTFISGSENLVILTI